MNTIPAPSLVLSREEWPDADFDLPDDIFIHAHCDKGDIDEDWDVEMDLGKTGGAKVKALTTRPSLSQQDTSRMFTIRPPLSNNDNNEIDDDNDEGLSTIRATAFPRDIFKQATPSPTLDEDIEAAFALPSDLTCLSLAPFPLNHKSSKSSLEWGDKDHTSSSQSSDAYSSLSFADASSSSNSTSSVSLPNSETDKDAGDDDDSELEGLVIPSTIFESCHAGRDLNKILEIKKKAQFVDRRVKVATPDPEDDFEIGLVIDDSADLSPSRLLTAQQQQSQRGPISRSYSMPPRPNLSPPLRLKGERAKSPNRPPPSSARQLSKLRLSPSPPLQTVRAFQALSSAPPSSPAIPFLSPKSGGLRGQKSHSGLKPPAVVRRATRKASLSSLMEVNYSPASGSGPAPESSAKLARYEVPTAASRAKSHKSSSTGRIPPLEYIVPPTRPCTPSNPAALRLTMPSLSRFKSRPSLASVFSPVSNPAPSTSPMPPSPPPPPSASIRARQSGPPPNPPPSVPKILRRPKRLRTYGDGTELDAIEDLPTDREKEGRFRVRPKSHGNRVPGGSYTSKSIDKATIGMKGKPAVGATELTVFSRSASTPKLTEVPCCKIPPPEIPVKKKKNASSQSRVQTRRKPTLIRNLGGTGAPKTVGDMKWNPQTLRWEGNDHVLRDFDAATGSSMRPALITHLTGSSIGSPVGSFASGTRIVGNMIFDPARMCWISTIPAEDDEPDIFANLADDEEDTDGWESKGGTIRGLQQLTLSESDTSVSSVWVEAPSHTRAPSDSGSDRGSRASIVYNVDEAFLRSCRLAEERHHVEMRGWCMTPIDVSAPPSHLYDIRALATRKY